MGDPDPRLALVTAAIHLRRHPQHSHHCRCDEFAAAALSVLPEAEVTEEWGVACLLPGNEEHVGRPFQTRRDAEVSADRLRAIWRSGDAVRSAIDTIHVVRRTRTRYAEHVTEWTEVGDE